MKNSIFSVVLVAIVAVCAVSVAQGTIIAQHLDDNNPTTESWTAGGSSATAGVNDGGTLAWQIDTLSVGALQYYIDNLTQAEADEALTYGAVATIKMRVDAPLPYTPANGASVEIKLGTYGYVLMFGAQADGDQVVAAPAHIGGGFTWADEGAGNVYHTYKLVYDAGAANADLFVDGIERVSNITGWNPGDKRVLFGDQTSTTGNDTNTYWSEVTLETVPEPASAALLGLGGLMMLRRRRGA